MSLNARLQLVNKTNYFNPNFSRVVNTFVNPSTYSAKESKQEGIETRLYYEYRDCSRLGGQTFFYTLTYTDDKLPHFEGVPCFDYKHLISFLNGGLKKMLLRKYGTSFRYFVGAEFGEGAGSRGFANNPHYHVLLFLRPDNCCAPYKPIEVSEMRHLVKMYWQGFDEERTGYQDYRTCRYGIAMPSDLGDKITDFKACKYCAKYVTKDVHFYKNESIIRKRIYSRYYPILYNSQLIQNNFFVDYIIPRFEISPDDLPSKEDWYFSCSDLLTQICPKLSFLAGHDVMTSDYLEFFKYILTEANLETEYHKYVEQIVFQKVKEQINLWRNRYSNKYRISNGLGSYALSFIDERNMRVPFPKSGGGFKNRPVPLYYFRKLCCNVVKDRYGNNKYILNQKGLQYTMSIMENKLKRMSVNAQFNFNQLNNSIYNEFLQLYPSTLSLEEIKAKVSLMPEVFRRYSEYKLIYEFRFFPISEDMPTICPSFDFENFIQTSLNDEDFNPNGAIDFLKDDCHGYLPYSNHTYFSKYVFFFHLFDFLSDYFFLIEDLRKKDEQEEFKRIKKFFNERKLNPILSKFNG